MSQAIGDRQRSHNASVRNAHTSALSRLAGAVVVDYAHSVIRDFFRRYPEVSLFPHDELLDDEIGDIRRTLDRLRHTRSLSLIRAEASRALEVHSRATSRRRSVRSGSDRSRSVGQRLRGVGGRSRV